MSTEHAWHAGPRPILESHRLLLRPFVLSDANEVQRLAGHPLIAATTVTIPHPYPDGAALDWITQHADWFHKRRSVQFAIELKREQKLIGCVDLLGISIAHSRAELGYWIGVDFWNHGYCTEAAKEVLAYGFEKMKLQKITARHLSTNPASGKVMLKVGMKKEGHLRNEFLKTDQFLDIEVYGLLQSEWATPKNKAGIT
jgi:ribosomal-protein-alanine N-acetyltransferase